MMGENNAEQKLAAIEAEIARLRQLIDIRLGAIADELRRAERRDEWSATQIREARRDLIHQAEVMAALRAAAYEGGNR